MACRSVSNSNHLLARESTFLFFKRRHIQSTTLKPKSSDPFTVLTLPVEARFAKQLNGFLNFHAKNAR